MSDIPQHLIDSILIRCGRRCCVCRRFRPTKLQVHHILEQSKGGTDEEDNLMPICLICHSDVHSHVPFTRRFTLEELKGHRDALFRAVEEGRLPPDEEDNTSELDRQVVVNVFANETRDNDLSPAAVELLLASVHAKDTWQGRIAMVDRCAGKLIFIQDQQFGTEDRREQARYLAGLEELESSGFASYDSESLREVTHAGYLKADEILAEHGRKTE